MDGTGVKFALVSPSPVRGAIAIVQVWGRASEVDGTLAATRVKPVMVGAVAVREIAGIDEGVVARVSDSRALLFPHAGPAVVRGVLDALKKAGAVEVMGRDAGWVEAADEFEERMLGALAAAASPLAVDLLLDQPRRWRETGSTDLADARSVARDAALRRLIVPPLVVAIGPPNIGKSTLLNALAKRAVSIVADEAGTTRDHVGAMVEFAGLVVNYIDAPGIGKWGGGGGAADAEAQAVAMKMARSADLVLSCGDAREGGAGFLDDAVLGGRESLRVALRADLAPPTSPTADAARVDVTVSVLRRTGIEELVSLVRERLVPRAAIDDPRPWKFWDCGGPAGGVGQSLPNG